MINSFIADIMGIVNARTIFRSRLRCGVYRAGEERSARFQNAMERCEYLRDILDATAARIARARTGMALSS